MNENHLRPRTEVRHRPTGIVVAVGMCFSRATGRQRSMAIRILRSILAGGATDNPEVIRTYDLSLPRIKDNRTGVSVHSPEEISDVIDRGKLDDFVAAGVRFCAGKGKKKNEQ